MPPIDKDTFTARAAKARALAALESDRETRTALAELADSYEALAAETERGGNSQSLG